jgi:hypothetical protein
MNSTITRAAEEELRIDVQIWSGRRREVESNVKSVVFSVPEVP